MLSQAKLLHEGHDRVVHKVRVRKVLTVGRTNMFNGIGVDFIFLTTLQYKSIVLEIPRISQFLNSNHYGFYVIYFTRLRDLNKTFYTFTLFI